jgi:hypothetical protein
MKNEKMETLSLIYYDLVLYSWRYKPCGADQKLREIYWVFGFFYTFFHTFFPIFIPRLVKKKSKMLTQLTRSGKNIKANENMYSK